MRRVTLQLLNKDQNFVLVELFVSNLCRTFIILLLFNLVLGILFIKIMKASQSEHLVRKTQIHYIESEGHETVMFHIFLSYESAYY